MANIKKSRPTGERGYLKARAQAALDEGRAAAAKEVARLKAQRAANGIKEGRGLVGKIAKIGMLNAVKTNGPEVLSDEGYWRDMKRLYPESTADMSDVPGDSINGRNCRMGKVAKRVVSRDGRLVYLVWDKAINDFIEVTREEWMK